jgi:hypothetical protein
VLRTLQEVAQAVGEGGTEAVAQLRKIAVHGFERAWLQGLITQVDVDRVTSITSSAERPADAPKPPIDDMPLKLNGRAIEAALPPPQPPVAPRAAPPRQVVPISDYEYPFAAGGRR